MSSPRWELFFLVCDLHGVGGSPADPQVRYRVRSCGICGGQNGTVIGVSPVLQFSPVTTIPPMLHTHLRLHVGHTKRTNGWSLKTFQKSNALLEIGEIWIKSTSTFFMAYVGDRHSSVGITTRYGLEGPGVESR